MFALCKLAIHRHRADEGLKDVRWVNYDPSPPLGLRLGLDGGCVKISNGDNEVFRQVLGEPNKTALKGAFGECSLSDADYTSIGIWR